MNPVVHAAKLGFSRAWIEFKQFLRNPQEITWTLITTVIFLVVVWFQRDAKVDGISLALLTLPSMLGMSIAYAGFSGVASMLSYEREDGTLLRAKAIPQGMVGYLVSRTIYTVYITIVSLAALFIPGLFMISGLLSNGLTGLLLFIGYFILGLLATAPWGAMIGSMVKSSGSGWGLTFLAIGGVTAISGIFYPITALPGWVQIIGQIFPVYWLGLGVRSAFLPDTAATAEIGGSWRPELTLLVIGVWIVVGFLLAPRVLRRMAQRESGSDVEARRQKAIQRGY